MLFDSQKINKKMLFGFSLDCARTRKFRKAYLIYSLDFFVTIKTTE